MEQPVAAIDVGSNSMRVAVIRADCHGYLEVVEESRAVPRLIRDVQSKGKLSTQSIEHVLDVLRDFRAVAHGAGAGSTVAVATAAVRDAANSNELVRRVREAIDLDLRVVSGNEEARLAFLGAVHSLPVTHGMVIDVGGGSMELIRFEDREPRESWTLPLGAVRLTDRFLTDPPTQQQVRALRKHALSLIRKAGIPALEAGDRLVGTGGTIRNLAKVDRAQHVYPLPRLHGYTVTRGRLRAASDLLRSRKLASRMAVAGLNEDRADTIVAGALVVQAALEALAAREIAVAGQGLREGIALAMCSETLPDIATVRGTVIARAQARFAPERAEIARRRAYILEALRSAVSADAASPEVDEALSAAVALLDLGRSIDYYGRHRHTESLLLERGLSAFTHREQALICAIVRQAGQERYDPLAYRPLITADDRPSIARASALLAAADEIEQRLSPDTPPYIQCARSEGDIVVSIELPYRWDGGTLRKRFMRSFGLSFVVGEGV